MRDRESTRKRSRRMWSGMGERSEMLERLWRAELTVRESSDGGVLIHSHICYITSMLSGSLWILFFSLQQSERDNLTDSFRAEIAGPQILKALRFLRQRRTKLAFCLHVSVRSVRVDYFMRISCFFFSEFLFFVLKNLVLMTHHF